MESALSLKSKVPAYLMIKWINAANLATILYLKVSERFLETLVLEVLTCVLQLCIAVWADTSKEPSVN